jgi:hypothetical protein
MKVTECGESSSWLDEHLQSVAARRHVECRGALGERKPMGDARSHVDPPFGDETDRARIHVLHPSCERECQTLAARRGRRERDPVVRGDPVQHDPAAGPDRLDGRIDRPPVA